MRKEKTVEITVETDEVLVVSRRTRRAAPVWCDGCGAEVEMVAPEVAARLSDVSARTVYGWVEAGRLHFAETPDRALLVCLNSLNSRAN